MTIRVGACLSLSGRYARFGAAAGQALRVWQDLDGTAEVVVADDRSSARTLRKLLPEVAAGCDVLLGPYSTLLAQVAADFATERDLVLWNQGGAGDGVQTGGAGHVVSVPTPASRYAEPYVRWLAGARPHSTLWIVHGQGRFGRDAAAGASALARLLGLNSVRVNVAEALPVDLPAGPDASWHLFVAGAFDEDVRTVNHAHTLPFPPATTCAVAAGVAEFGHAVTRPDGIFGVAQWMPGQGRAVEVGPDESDLLARFARVHGGTPEYPAVQAVAAAVLATVCLRVAGSARRADLWSAATALDTSTLFGPFRVHPETGAQVGHDTVLVRWDGPGGLAAI